LADYFIKSYDKGAHKVIPYGFPLLDNGLKHFFIEDFKNKTNIKLFYAGSLNRKYRNPEFALEVFTKPNSFSYSFDLFTRGDCDHLINNYKNLRRIL
jgi:hypothetical protein